MRRIGPHSGFTLIEIMTALAILGLSLFVLLNAHLSAMNLQNTIYETTNQRQLFEAAVGKAEVEVLLGSMSGGGDFGARYPDFTWSFEAIRMSEMEGVLYYAVTVMLHDAQSDETPAPITFHFYNNNSEFDEGGLFSGTSGGAT